MRPIPKSKKILRCGEQNIDTRLWIALGEILAFPTGMLVSPLLLEVPWWGYINLEKSGCGGNEQKGVEKGGNW